MTIYNIPGIYLALTILFQKSNSQIIVIVTILLSQLQWSSHFHIMTQTKTGMISHPCFLNSLRLVINTPDSGNTAPV
jgi:hypothetical protein